MTTQNISIASDRITGYDFARTLALMGMVMISFSELGAEHAAPEWLEFILQIIIGRAAVAFVILAGVGLSLITKPALVTRDRAVIAASRKNLIRRALFLFVAGMLNTLIWPWDILHFYSVYFIIVALLIKASNRQIGALTAIAIFVFSVFMHLSQFERGSAWDSILLSDLWHLPGVIYHLLFCGLYPVFPWIGYIFIGIWLGRKDLTQRVFRKKILLAGTTVVMASQGAWWLFFYSYLPRPRLEVAVVKLLPWFKLDPWEPLPLFFFSGAGSAILVICIAVIIAEKFRSARWLAPFVAIGQSTLTLYLAHIPFGTLVTMLMDYYEWEYPLFTLWGTLLYFILAGLFCYQWNLRYKKGPLELWMRRFLQPVPNPQRILIG